MEQNRRFYDKYVSTHTGNLYGPQDLKKIEGQFFAWRSYFSAFLPKDRNAKILDLGCGNGGFVHWLDSLGYKNVFGLDISNEQVKAAEMLGIKGVSRGDIFDFLPSRRGEFEVIFARDILEHIPREKTLDFVELVAASLHSGGSFVVQTVNAENLLWGRLRHADFTHEQAFTKDSLRQVMSVAGFKDVQVCPQRPIVHGFISLMRYILWRSFELFMRGYLLVETGSHDGIFTQNVLAVAKK
jgi:2-polyprenyl-3-methyl-5-hydroxy-6-metoxy-1,4-benzoquinol methylase